MVRRLLMLVTLAWLARWAAIEAASHYARRRARRRTAPPPAAS
ncbi:MAG: hypothetical protein ACM3QU_02500 [Verrucomicrobiota bacterium]